MQRDIYSYLFPFLNLYSRHQFRQVSRLFYNIYDSMAKSTMSLCMSTQGRLLYQSRPHFWRQVIDYDLFNSLWRRWSLGMLRIIEDFSYTTIENSFGLRQRNQNHYFNIRILLDETNQLNNITISVSKSINVDLLNLILQIFDQSLTCTTIYYYKSFFRQPSLKGYNDVSSEILRYFFDTRILDWSDVSLIINPGIECGEVSRVNTIGTFIKKLSKRTSSKSLNKTQ